MAEALKPEIEFLKGFLPKELSDTELTDLVNAAILQVFTQLPFLH